MTDRARVWMRVADYFVGAMAVLNGALAVWQQQWVFAVWCGIALTYVAIARMRANAAEAYRLAYELTRDSVRERHPFYRDTPGAGY